MANALRCCTSWGIRPALNGVESWDVSFPNCRSKSCHFSSISVYSSSRCWERNTTVSYSEYCPCLSVASNAALYQHNGTDISQYKCLHPSDSRCLSSSATDRISLCSSSAQCQQKSAYTFERQKIFFFFLFCMERLIYLFSFQSNR